MQSNPSHRPHLRAVATALFVTVLWSSSWILVRSGLDDEQIDPLTFAGLRYTLAACVLLAWCSARPTHRQQLYHLPRSRWSSLAVLGVVYFSITQGAQFVAIDAQPAATSSLMLAPTALLVALLSGRSLGEPPQRVQFIGAALIVAGALLYFTGDLGATVLGMTASIVGLAANTTGSLLGRSANREGALSPVVVTTASMSTGAPILLITGVVVEGLPSLTARAIAIIAWLAVVNTAVAFSLWNRSLRHLVAVESSAINNTMLIQIAALAWIFLGESPGLSGVVGIGVVSLGAFLTTFSRQRPALT